MKMWELQQRNRNYKKASNRSHRTEEYNWTENALEGLNSRLDEAERQIGELEDNAMELTRTKLQNKKRIFGRLGGSVV